MVDRQRAAAPVTEAEPEGRYSFGGPTEPGVAYLLVLHRGGVTSVVLAEGESIVLGREPPAHVVHGERRLSRRHARFFREGAGVWVEDLGSTNGTWLDGARLTEPTRLRPGDEVSLGSVVVRVHVAAGAEQLAGLGGHDPFLARLEEEVVRARTFQRPFSLLLLGSLGRDPRPGAWAASLHASLRPVDVAALYGGGLAEILAPEMDRGAVETFARTIRTSTPSLGIGVAVYPDGGSSAQELLDAARDAQRAATTAEPVVFAASRVVSDGSGPILASDAMQALYATARRVATAALPVLLLGETGSGKEVLARAIHEGSPRRDKPFVCLNCGAVPASLAESTLFGHERGAFTGADRRVAGVFERASGGTLFLDEIGELSLPVQASLLRALETKRITRVGGADEIPVDVRFVAATHRDLEALCDEELFRRDLWFRLNAVTLRIPPLRERQADIAPLAARFLHDACIAAARPGLSLGAEAAACLRMYPWPGNVRELRNEIERAVVVADGPELAPADFSERVRRAAPGPAAAPSPAAARGSNPPSPEPSALADYREHLRIYERDLLEGALAQHAWNQTHTARALGLPLRTLVHKMRTLGVRRPS